MPFIYIGRLQLYNDETQFFSHPIWKKVSSRRKKALKFESKDDGEFYMSLSSFQQFFGKLEICHQSPVVMEVATAIANNSLTCKVKFDPFDFYGEWNREMGNAGGCGSSDQGGSQSFSKNPLVRNFL